MADEKIKTVADDMAQRIMLNSTQDALAFLGRAQTEFSDFNEQDLVAQGLSQDESGNLVFDPAIYTDGTRVMIAKVTQRDTDGTKLKAVIITPAPSLDQILADAQGKEWLAKIVDVQLNAAAVRELRKPDVEINDNSIVEILSKMPKTLADYVTSSRESSSTLLEGFEALWRDIKAALGDMAKAFKVANLSKKEFRRAMESKSYASRFYPMVEETKRGSVFEFAIQAFKAKSAELGYDTSIFDRWAANRDTLVIDANADDEDGEFSLDALTAAMSKPADGEAATTGEGANQTDATRNETATS